TFGKNDGDVKAVVVNMTSNPWSGLVTSAYEAELEALGGGEILEVVDVSDPETADGSFIQKVTSALLANPEVNSPVRPTDSFLVNGLAAAIAQAGLAEQIVSVGGFGAAAAIDMIREGQPGITATVGQAMIWESWGSIDTAIRVLNGQDPAYIGQPVQVVDQHQNMPEAGPYAGSIDWKSKCLAAWGKRPTTGRTRERRRSPPPLSARRHPRSHSRSGTSTRTSPARGRSTTRRSWSAVAPCMH